MPQYLTHFEELRKRLIICLSVYAALTIVCFCFSHTLIDFLISPLKRYNSAQLIFQAPYEAFLTHLKVSGLGGVLLASPVIFFHVWRFVAPGLYAHEKRLGMPVIAGSVILFLAGGSFAFFVVIPLGLNFLLGFQTESLRPLLGIGPYFSFLVSLVLVFGVLFVSPLAVLGLVRAGVVSSARMEKSRRVIIAGLFVLAAVMTPPDPVSQILLALPLWLLFEVSLFLARRVESRPENPEKQGDS